MFHKEGYTIIFITIIISAALAWVASSLVELTWLSYIIYALATFILIAVLQFFRNPKRDFHLSDQKVLSPVDGKVVVIEEVSEHEFFNEKRIQVSVFMSPINVHATRYPVGGKVVFSKYHPGKFLVAWHPKSSEENERTTVVVDNPVWGNVLFRQIAGALARRIVNYAKVDAVAKQASDFGFIKFGSRVDVFLPLDAKIKVTLNQKVKGGISVLAEK
ncbi:MAG: phosphatidylserine decarboxylase family protein [Flavobacteriaceae bacterium]|nr:phosphatidylserine decarboxylase family protein [Flavobacteriaceae bacterium]